MTDTLTLVRRQFVHMKRYPLTFGGRTEAEDNEKADAGEGDGRREGMGERSQDGAADGARDPGAEHRADHLTAPVPGRYGRGQEDGCCLLRGGR